MILKGRIAVDKYFLNQREVTLLMIKYDFALYYHMIPF